MGRELGEKLHLPRELRVVQDRLVRGEKSGEITGGSGRIDEEAEGRSVGVMSGTWMRVVDDEDGGRAW